MHCNSERRVLQCLNQLRRWTVEEDHLDGFDQTILSELLTLAARDPYLKPVQQKVKQWRREQAEPRQRQWIATLLRAVREQDSEYTIALEELLKDRLEAAMALLGKEKAGLLGPLS